MIILDLHPWVAKGAEYLSLSRDDKAAILWNKITEDQTPNPNPGSEDDFFLLTDLSPIFDEWGDEFECRIKTAHSLGNVGKVRWIDLGGHDYTGIF